MDLGKVHKRSSLALSISISLSPVSLSFFFGFCIFSSRQPVRNRNFSDKSLDRDKISDDVHCNCICVFEGSMEAINIENVVTKSKSNETTTQNTH